MKKTIGLFILFMFAAMPASALKLIVNDTGDRTVPSRSSAWNGANYTQQTYTTTTTTISKKDLADLKFLSDNIRIELVGTTWDYPNLVPEDTVKYTETGYYNPYSKLYTREAADYYALDTIEKPDTLVPVGYDE